MRWPRYSPRTYFVYLVIGVVLGLVVGSLPGTHGHNGDDILLPVTYSLPTLESIQILMGVFIGGITAGSVTAIAIGFREHPHPLRRCWMDTSSTLMGRSGEAISLMFLLTSSGICSVRWSAS